MPHLRCSPVGLPESLPDERLYSRLSRYEVLSAGHRSGATIAAIFGTERASIRSDLPTRLAGLVRFFGPSVSIDDVIENNTQLPYFRGFCTPRRWARLRSWAVRSSGSRTKMALGLPAGRTGAHSPMRFCVDCVAADVQEHATSYWHRSHQLPGVLVCWKHATPLWENLRLVRMRRSVLVLPELFLEDEDSRRCLVPDVGLDVLLELAKRSRQLLLGGYPPIGPNPVLDGLLERARSAGWVSATGSLRKRVWLRDVRSRLLPLSGLEEFRWADIDGEAAWITSLLHGHQQTINPLKFLLALVALGRDTELASGVRADLDAKERPSSEPVTRRSVAGSEVISESVLNEVGNGASLRTAASRAGISVQTARVYASRAGVLVQSRPKRITADVRGQIALALKEGRSVQDVCHDFSLSNSSVWRVLVESSRLHKAHADAAYLRERSRRRSIWIACVSGDRQSRPQRREARRLAPAAYAWLYRNDRDWLFGAREESG